MNRKLRIIRAAIFLVLWLFLTFLLLLLYFDESASFLPQFLATLVITGLTAFPGYYSSRVLVPRYLYQKKIRRFASLLLLASLIGTIFTYVAGGGPYAILTGKPLFTNLGYIISITPALFVVNTMVITISCAIHIITDRFGMEQELQKVGNEKINAELSFLRAQVNPHFLFNVLNTIYFQIHKENAEARNSIEKFSEMLRYQLYECNSDKIDIGKEIAYIKNYVAIQQLRMEPGTDLRMNVPDDLGTFRIAPLLILPLIENAIKYISHYKDPTKNKLFISIYKDNESQLVVHVLNTYNPLDGTKQATNSGGLGLKNMERRLALLYPGTHSFSVKNTENTYETTLKIQYND